MILASWLSQRERHGIASYLVEVAPPAQVAALLYVPLSLRR